MTTTPTNPSEATEGEVLIVVSKVKKYIREKSGMNTSDSVTAVLSNHLRKVCDQAIAEAGRAGRKTVMDRDFLFDSKENVAGE